MTVPTQRRPAPVTPAELADVLDQQRRQDAEITRLRAENIRLRREMHDVLLHLDDGLDMRHPGQTLAEYAAVRLRTALEG